MSTPEYETIRYEVGDGVCRITLDRPDQLNALSPQLLTELRDAITRSEADPDVRVNVLAGAGRCFSAGGDLGELPTRSPSGVPEGMDVGTYMLAWREELREWHDDYLRFAEMRKPVIAQVHGWCLGGGAWLAVAADMTFASSNAVFGQPEVRQGMPCGAIWALVAGWKHAMRYSLTGDRLDAGEALRIGLVNEVVADEELAAHVSEIARRVALLPMDAIVLNKQLIRRSIDAMGFRQALLVAAEHSGWLMGAWRPEIDGAFEGLVASEGVGAAVRQRDAAFRAGGSG